MLKINLKQLEAFVATAEFSSFTKASEELFLTQSTVSSHVGALESALGIRLIQRSARQRVMLTKEGELVYREAREILDRCQALQDLKNQDREHQLVIGASSVPGQCLMPEAVKAVIDWLFRDMQLDFIICGHFDWNSRSRRVIEKCGFRYVKTVEFKTRIGTVEKAMDYILYHPERGDITC